LVAGWPFFPRFEPTIELRTGADVRVVPVPGVNRYRCQIENFSQAIRGKAQPLLGRDDAVGQASVLEALRRSALDLGRPVSV
jgi:predicted dehydrogenase